MNQYLDQHANLPRSPAQAPAQADSQPDMGSLIQELMNMGFTRQEIEEITAKMNKAEQMRHQPMPSMRGNHRIQTAANPLEFIGRGIQQYRAGKRLSDAESEKEKLQKLLRGQYSRLGSALGSVVGGQKQGTL